MDISHENIVISGWDVTSPIANSGMELQDQLINHRPSDTSTATSTFGGEQVRSSKIVPDFNIQDRLGKKGTRTFDRTTGLVVDTATKVINTLNIQGPESESWGVSVGTSTGSIRSITEFIRDTLVSEKPYFVNPSLFPNVVINCAAGQCAIWHKLKGVNATLSNGYLSSLMAIRYAEMSLKCDYSTLILSGGVEEYCEQSAWAFQTCESKHSSEFGEGCSLVALESFRSAKNNGHNIYAEIVGSDVRFSPMSKHLAGKHLANKLALCIKHTLKKAKVDPSDVWAVSNQSTGEYLKRVEDMALTQVFDKNRPEHVVSVSDLAGDSYSAMGAMQLTALLALHQLNGSESAYSLLTSLSYEGNVGCLLLRHHVVK